MDFLYGSDEDDTMTSMFGGHHESSELVPTTPGPEFNDLRFATRAATNGDTVSLTLALQSGFPINSAEAELLATAVRNGRVEAVKFLLARGANPNQEGKYRSLPLHSAVVHRASLGIIDILVTAGAAVDGSLTKRPLLAALQSGERLTVDRLLHHGAALDVTEEGSTALHCAAESGRPELIGLVLKAAADKSFELVNLPNRWGVTPAMLVACNASADPLAMKVLLDAGANPCARTPSKPKQPGTSVLYNAISNNLGVTRVLLAASPEVAKELVAEHDPQAEPLLHRLAYMGIGRVSHTSRPNPDEVMQMVALLVASGADVNRVVASRGAPLHEAVCRHVCTTHTLAALLHFGADVDTRHPVTGNTALHMAVECGMHSVVTLLILHGADRQARNNMGLTPLGMLEPNDRSYSATDVREAFTLKSEKLF